MVKLLLEVRSGTELITPALIRALRMVLWRGVWGLVSIWLLIGLRVLRVMSSMGIMRRSERHIVGRIRLVVHMGWYLMHIWKRIVGRRVVVRPARSK